MPEFRLLMKTAQPSIAEYLLKRNQFLKHALSTHWLNQTQFSQLPTITFPHSAASPQNIFMKSMGLNAQKRWNWKNCT